MIRIYPRYTPIGSADDAYVALDHVGRGRFRLRAVRRFRRLRRLRYMERLRVAVDAMRRLEAAHKATKRGKQK